MRPETDSLIDELDPKIEYWIVNGASCSGKTTAAKYISNEFGYKLIEFETFLPTVQ